jgi:hypothetical protein
MLWKLSKNFLKKDIYPGKKPWVKITLVTEVFEKVTKTSSGRTPVLKGATDEIHIGLKECSRKTDIFVTTTPI